MSTDSQSKQDKRLWHSWIGIMLSNFIYLLVLFQLKPIEYLALSKDFLFILLIVVVSWVSSLTLWMIKIKDRPISNMIDDYSIKAIHLSPEQLLIKRKIYFTYIAIWFLAEVGTILGVVAIFSGYIPISFFFFLIIGSVTIQLVEYPRPY